MIHFVFLVFKRYINMKVNYYELYSVLYPLYKKCSILYYDTIIYLIHNIVNLITVNIIKGNKYDYLILACNEKNKYSCHIIMIYYRYYIFIIIHEIRNIHHKKL